MVLTLIMLLGGIVLRLTFPTILITTVALSASFGPVLALANLSATMDQTLAAGERVLSLLEEWPETEDVAEGETPDFTGAEVKNSLSLTEKKKSCMTCPHRSPRGRLSLSQVEADPANLHCSSC